MKLIGLMLIIMAIILPGCAKEAEQAEPKSEPQITEKQANVEDYGKPDLMLSQAQFVKKMGDDGRMHPVPGAAKLVMLYETDGGWAKHILEDDGSNVFHKAMYFHPEKGAPGILTIGANEAMLKIWRYKEGEWQSETLWNPVFGGKQNRLRDMEIGDVTGNGKEEIVIATHDQGVVAVVEQKEEEYKVHELDRESDTFVHEIELGDVDGDGKMEIFATPSAPNKLDGSIQPGLIIQFDYEQDEFKKSIVEEFPERHVKELLTYKLKEKESPLLFAALEGESLGGGIGVGDTTRIKYYKFEDGKMKPYDVTSLPGKLCRFITGGELKKAGERAVVASTHKSGIWLLSPGEDEWSVDLIDDQSSGFEHATLILDRNQDGKDEIYVAADNQKTVNKYVYENGEWNKELIMKLDGDYITFGLTGQPAWMLEK